MANKKAYYYETPSGSFAHGGYIFDKKGNIKAKLEDGGSKGGGTATRLRPKQAKQIEEAVKPKIQEVKPSPIIQEDKRKSRALKIEMERKRRILEAQRAFQKDRNLDRLRRDIYSTNLETASKRIEQGVGTEYTSKTLREFKPETKGKVTKENITTVKEFAKDVRKGFTVKEQEQFKGNNIIFRENESFNPKTGMFEQRAFERGAGGTAISSPPTLEEQKIISEANRRGSFAGTLRGVLSIPEKIGEPVMNLLGIEDPTKRTIITPEGKKDILFSNVLPTSKKVKEPDIIKRTVGINPFESLSEGTLRAGEFAEKKLGRFAPEILRQPSGFGRSEVKGTLTALYTFAGFEPLIRTGTVKQESVFTEVFDPVTGQGRFVRKADIKELLRRPEITGGKVNFDISFSEKSRRIEVLLKNLKDRTNPKGVKEVLNVAEEVYGKSFVKDFKEQQGLISKRVPKSITFEPSPVPSIVEFGGKGKSIVKPTQQDLFNVQIGVQLPKGAVTSSTTLKTKIKPIKIFKSDVTTQSKQNINILSTSRTKQKLETGLDSLSRTRQEIKQKSRQALSPALATLTQQKTQQRLTQENILRQRGNQGRLKKPKPKIPKIPIIKLSDGGINIKIKRDKEDFFKVLGKRFGEFRTLGTFKTKGKAEKKLKSFLETTLGRSGKILRDGTALKFRELGGLLKTRQFRPSKKRKDVVVQRAKFSLGSIGETKEIQYFKKKKRKKKSLF